MKGLRLAACCGIAILSALPAPSLAEEAVHGHVAEGPDFELPAGMRIARQDILISPRAVRLVYAFQSTRHQTVHFSFALPDMPVDASPDAIGLAARGAPRPPAARYRLVADKYAASSLVAFCPAESGKTSPTTFEWQARDVVPGRTIEALFFMNPDAWPDD